ncbi:MAG: magnetochrome domain-containing protein, partial [Magnetococcales bacterium]|nr:magnetochrome domain-containing protein [Magnetococcales bacterium]
MNNRRPNRGGPLASILMVLIILGAGGAFYERYKETLAEWTRSRVPRFIRGEILGSLPAPTEPTLPEQVIDTLQVKPTRSPKMVVKRLPIIARNAHMPHAYWGPCTRCHLIQGGA